MGGKPLNIHELLKQVPGFRSGLWWKGVIAVLGYLLIALLLVSSAPGFVAGLEILILIFLVTNAWGLRSRAPMLGSANKATAAGGWILLTVLFLAAFAVIPSTSEKPAQPSGSAKAVQLPPTPKPTETPKPTSTPIPGIGSTLQTRNWRIIVDRVEKIGPTLAWSQFGNKDQAVGEFFAVYITLENIAKENFGVSFTDFQLKSAEGVTYKVATCLGCLSGYAEYKGMKGLGLASGQIPPGVPVKMPIIFDVAPGAKGLTFVFTQEGGRTWALE